MKICKGLAAAVCCALMLSGCASSVSGDGSDGESAAETSASASESAGEKELLVKAEPIGETVASDFFNDYDISAQPLGRLSIKAESGAVRLTVSGADSELALYMTKVGEEGYSEYPLEKKDSGDLEAVLPFGMGDLSEIRITGTLNGKKVYNDHFLDRSDATGNGYIYQSSDSRTHGYVMADKETSFVFLADNTVFTNGDFVAMNQATHITADDESLIKSGEIYSAASKSSNADLTTLQWFRYYDGRWYPLSTDRSTDENGNIGARADVDSAGIYVLMASGKK